MTGARGATRAMRVQSLWSGYGEIVRVRLEGGPAETVIVKEVIPPREVAASERRSHDRKLRSYQVEAAFYREHSSRCLARVPRCYAAEALDSGFRFVLEDLDAAGFAERRHRLRGADLDLCLGWLATFHATYMGQEPSGLWPVGTYWHLETRPDELEAMAEGPLRSAAAPLDRALSAARFQTLVHGDAKPANFCFGRDGIAAVDFQYVGGGCGMKDVAYLMSCLDDARIARDAPHLLDAYFGHLRWSLAPSFDADAIETEWRALLPLACADFERFLSGWAAGHRTSRYAAHQIDQALCSLPRTSPGRR